MGIVGFALIIAFFLVISLLYVRPLLLQRAKAVGIAVTPMMMIGMRLRGVDQSAVIEPVIKAKEAGIDIDPGHAEAHYLASGNIAAVVDALIMAKKSDIEADFNGLAAIDLAGRDVVAAVKNCGNPQVLELKFNPKAGDGKELAVKALVTVRNNIKRFVGGADSDFLLKQIGDSMTRGIEGESDSQAIIKNADELARKVMKLGVDSGSAYDLLDISVSIDIA